MNPAPATAPPTLTPDDDAPTPHRAEWLDALRGATMVWMALFHFAFDLNLFRLLQPRQSFTTDPFWTLQRTGIVSLFLMCAGMALALALHRGQSWRRFGHRWFQVAACAALVSVGSLLVFPRSWISFGVLHGMAVMLPLARLAAPLGRWLWPLGLLCVLLPQFVAHPFFDTRWTNWVGLVTAKPVTEDFVPVLPWLGVMLWGVALGQWQLRRGAVGVLSTRPLGWAAQFLATLGRWPLRFYMIHQPVLLGLIAAVSSVALWLK